MKRILPNNDATIVGPSWRPMKRPDVGLKGWRELVLVVLAFSALTVAMTSPLAFHLGEVGRVDNGDGQFSVWNVAWVARTLVLDPRHVFDANIFYPRRGTLAYSESNLGAGALAMPVYWASGNAYAALNFALIASFVLSACGMYYLVRHLVADRRAAIVSATLFSDCSYLFGHLPHIQLLMTAGLPFGMLAFHRLTERPTTTRGAALGIAMALQAYFCGYYAVFSALLVGLAALVAAKTRHLWTSARYVTAILVASVVAIVAALPVVMTYRAHQLATGFSRGLGDAQRFSAVWRAYLSSPAYAHRWMGWDAGIGGREALFPGFVALIFGVMGAAHGLRRGGRLRETAVLYSSFALLAFWASLGPVAHLYSALYSMIPVFSFLRAPSRFGLVVDFSLSVLAGMGVAALLATLAAAMDLGYGRGDDRNRRAHRPASVPARSHRG